MIELGVNIDHVATLRQVRGTEYPDPIRAALLAEEAGANLITLHLREDRRHIQDRDVEVLRPRLKTRMNLEMAVTDEMVEVALRVKPQDVCLVPEKRQELTTEGGLDVVGGFDAIAAVTARLQSAGIRVSLFISTNEEQIRAAKAAGARAIEIHTGSYADACATERGLELEGIRAAVALGRAQGVRVNAGHGLHFGNVGAIAGIVGISELNIGHALVAEAVFMGWKPAIQHMKTLIAEAQN